MTQTDRPCLPEVALGNLLKEKKLTIATAESCTGGTIASLLTRHAGSSDFFTGAVVAYCNEVKHNLLGVSNDTLENKGAVSSETVDQMVRGVCKLMRTDIGIAVSGVAGPGGGSEEKPVGTVWIAVGTKDRTTTKRLNLTEWRDQNIQLSAIEAIFLAQEFVEKNF